MLEIFSPSLWFVRPQLRVLNHSSVIPIVSSPFLLVFSIALAEISLLDEANSCVNGLITNRAVVCSDCKGSTFYLET
jgi:hypothetical protein